MSSESTQIEAGLIAKLEELRVRWGVDDDNVMTLTADSPRALRLATWAVCETYKRAAGLSRDKTSARIQL